MEIKDVEKLLRQIRRGENVLENIKQINLHISDLRYHAEFGKSLEAGVRKILHKDATSISNQLFFAVEFFIKSNCAEEKDG